MVKNSVQRKINSIKYQTFLFLREKYEITHNAYYFCILFFISIRLSKLTLKYEPDLDFVLIAITAPLKDYRFCYKLNTQLNIQFYRLEELSLQNYSDEYQIYFTRYHYNLSQSETDFYLLANKGSEGFLIPEMNKVDFFILIKNYIDNENLAQFIAGINKIPEVLVAIEVDPKKLKSKENLIF